MEFCEVCGSCLKETPKGLWCSRCKKLAPSAPKAKAKDVRRKEINGVYVVDEYQAAMPKISEKCPNCGNDESFYWVSAMSGEHAGVRRERTVRHFKCAKCSHSWAKST